jgi:hypothetical protein
MFVYMTLVATTGCTVFWRRMVFLLFSWYFWMAGNPVIYFDAFLFFVGSMLADLSLSVGNNSSVPPSPSIQSRRNIRHHLTNSWPIALTIFALYLGSQASQHTDRKEWSNYLERIGKQIFPKGSTSLNFSNGSYTSGWLCMSLRNLSNLLNYIFSNSPTRIISSLPRIPREYILSNVPSPRNAFEINPRMDNLWIIPAAMGRK